MMPIYGSLRGKGLIYDADGELILQPSEKILYESSGDSIYVLRLQGRKKSVVMDRTKEASRLYITNRRIVFIRSPEPYLAAKPDLNPFGIGASFDKALRARRLKQTRSLEFVEIPLARIGRIEIRKGKYANLEIEDGLGTFEVHLDNRSKADNKLKTLFDAWEAARKSPLGGQESLSSFDRVTYR